MRGWTARVGTSIAGDPLTFVPRAGNLVMCNELQSTSDTSRGFAHDVRMTWFALVLAAVYIIVLGAGCGTDNGCCAMCSPPAGACPGDPPGHSAPFPSGDAGVADAMGEQ